MTYAVGKYNYDEIAADIKGGTFDGVLDELDLVVQGRKAERDKWQPLNELLDMLRNIDSLQGHSLAQKASLGAEYHQALKDRYLEHPDPAVTGLASGVHKRVLTDLLGMTADAAVRITQGWPVPVTPVPATQPSPPRKAAPTKAAPTKAAPRKRTKTGPTT